MLKSAGADAPRAAGAGPSSSLLVYSVAVALGLSFSAVLLFMAWNNALRNETRNFAFDTVAIRSAVEANLRTAGAVVDALATGLADLDDARFAAFAGSALGRYDFVTGVAHLRLPSAPGVQLLRASGSLTDAALDTSLSDPATARMLRQGLLPGAPAVPLVREGEESAGRLVLLQAGVAAADGSVEVAALALDVAGLVRALAIEPAVRVALYTESEGVAGRRLVYRRPAQAGGGGAVVEALEQQGLVTLERYSVRLLTAKDLFWRDLDKGLLFVALVLGAGITLLLVALARARELQTRELEARNRVIEEQVRQQTRELAEARDQALEASRVKSDFLASMSHEIRTPLNAIIGMAELLSETRLTAEQGSYVGVFRNAGEALLSLVNDILDLSKIEAEQLELEHIGFDLRELVEQSVDIHALKADGKDIELVVDIADGVPGRVTGDPGRLRQILLNLVGNALKFTARGAIVVRVAPAAAGLLHFEVADSGIGVPADKLESIFQSFTQVDSSTTRKYGGTGLGLAISRRLVEMMGGRIWVESAVGVGSTFQFDVALPAALAPPVRPALPAGRVLVVSAVPAAGQVLTSLSSACGLVAAGVASTSAAEAALAAARAAAEPFDVIVIDADLAGADLAWLAAQRSAGLALPVVVLFRPSTVASGIERLRALGSAFHVVKPVKREPFVAALASALGSPAPAAASAVVTVAPAAAAARILLVEDNEDNRLLVRAYLRQSPYEISEAVDGAEAVRCFTSESFDLVLMDMQMPIMDGCAATTAIRAFERAEGRAPVPVLALSANAVKEDAARSRAAGCDDHLTKPIKKQVLLDALARHLARAPRS